MIDLNKVYALGLEKFAGDINKAEEFTSAFVKEASAIPGMSDMFFRDNAGKGKDGGMLPSILEGAGKGLGGALVTGAVGLIGAGMSSLNNGALHNQFLKALEQAISTNRVLKEAKREKVIQYATTIQKFAPHVATDPNLLSSILANAVHGEGIDPNTVKLLVELESRYRDSSGFNPKSWV